MRFKAAARSAWDWLIARQWLLYSLIGLFWGGLLCFVLLVKNNMALGRWPLPYVFGMPGQVIDRFEHQSVDWRFEIRGEEPGPAEIVVLQIGNSSFTGTTCSEEDFKKEPDLKLLEKWPYPRKAWGKIIDKLCAAGARSIGVDVVFATPSNFGLEDDIACRKLFKLHQNSLVLAATYKQSDEASAGELLMPNEVLMDELGDYKEIIGAVNFEYGPAGAIRQARTAVHDGEVDLYSFPTLVAKKAGVDVSGVPSDFWINYAGGPDSFKMIDLYKIFYSKTWKGELKNGDAFKDKIILIGASASILQDFHNTPVGIMPGVVIHANVISNLFARPQLKAVESALFVLGAGWLQGLLLGFFRRPQSKLIPAVLFFAIIGLVAYAAFIQWHILLPLFAPWLVVSLTSFSVITWQATTEFLARQKTRRTLETYVSPNVAEFILKNQRAYEAAQAGQRKACTILFSDIRDFTSTTENAADETEVVHQLNEYLTEMVHCVFDHGGTLHKFIGDGIMAAWGDTHSLGAKQDALEAVKTAVAMRERLAQLNEKWLKEGRKSLRIGVGLNHGTPVVGAVGSTEAPLRLEFTIIGDAVNVAARVESETKNQKVDILISRPVHDLVADHIEAESRGAVPLKGKAGKVEVFFLKAVKRA